MDTSALVALERAAGSDFSAAELDPGEPMHLPAIVWAEALIGVRMAKKRAIATRRMAFLDALRGVTGIVPFTDEIAGHYADIYAACSRAGTPIPQNDLAVAATARYLEARVLVGALDEAHFRRVKGLKVVVLE